MNQMADNSFKEQQLTHERVQAAYAEKGTQMTALLKAHQLTNMQLQLFFRAFKQEGILELWGKKPQAKSFTLLKTYPICAASGDLGPKREQGDYQVPEGVYFIEKFNPKSDFHLSVGINYPNASDKIRGTQGKLGGDIYIHGDCVTVGCLPMTDENIKEIYILAVEARNNGQIEIPVHIFPAKLTPATMAALKKAYKSSPNLPLFWKELQPIYQAFERSKKLPAVQISSTGRYSCR